MKCPQCGKYTMKESCCTQTAPAKPPKFSVEDRYAGYRRKAKHDDFKEKGLI